MTSSFVILPQCRAAKTVWIKIRGDCNMNDLLGDSMLKDLLAEQQHISVCFRVFAVNVIKVGNH